MNRKCKCGETHNFRQFKRFKTDWKGTTTHYQFFCEKLGKLMILTTSTYPQGITDLLCPSMKSRREIETILDSDTFFNSGLYCDGIQNHSSHGNSPRLVSDFQPQPSRGLNGVK